MGKFADKIEKLLDETDTGVPRKSAAVEASDKLIKLYETGQLKDIIYDVQKEDELDTEDRRYYTLLKDYYFKFLLNSPKVTPPKYKILSAPDSPVILETLVQEALADGWKLYGSPFVDSEGKFYQAIIK